MVNVLLNNFCNFDCPYCFANNVRDEDADKMSMEDFKWVINFINESNTDSVRLIGGEPTMHPEFVEMFLEASRQPNINHIHIFTNGSYKDRYNELFYLASKRLKRFSALINFNDPGISGDRKYESMRRNVRKLTNMPNTDVTLGINFYKPDQDYRHILDTAEQYNINQLRWALTVPQVTDNLDVKDHFDKNSDVIVEFIKDAVQRGIDPHPDCTSAPVCALSDEQIRELSLIGHGNLRTRACSPIIDIKPDLTAIRCFAMDDYSIDVKDYDNIMQLKKHFTRVVDSQYQNEPLIDECETCTHFQNEGQTCACLAYF